MDFRQALHWSDQCNELKTVSVPVSADLELAAIVNRLCKAQAEPPAVLFSNVVSSQFSVVANLFAKRQRLDTFLHDLHGRSFAERLELLPDEVKDWSSFAHWLSNQSLYRPQQVDQPSQTDRLNLGGFNDLPQVKMWPEDAGCYLSLATMISRDAENGHLNCGIYRVQIHDNQHATVHWRPGSDAARQFDHYRRRNQTMSVVMVIGCDPRLTFASCTSLPADGDELMFAGWLKGEPVTYYRSELSGLPVPLPYEFVFEGEIDPHQQANDGPFANHSGYYSQAISCPVFKLQHIAARPDAVYPITVVGPPPMENIQLAKAAEPLLRLLLRRQFAAVVDAVYVDQGIFHGAAIVQLASDVDGDVKAAIASHPLLRRSRCLIFIDSTIALHQPELVFWRCLNQPMAQLITIEDGRLIIDATGHHGRQLVASDQAILELIATRWAEYGLP